ncbi:unnamed protein product, partial [Staurois parvus]
PISASQCHLSVPPISAISASSTVPISATISVPISAASLAHISEGEKEISTYLQHFYNHKKLIEKKCFFFSKFSVVFWGLFKKK